MKRLLKYVLVVALVAGPLAIAYADSPTDAACSNTAQPCTQTSLLKRLVNLFSGGVKLLDGGGVNQVSINASGQMAVTGGVADESTSSGQTSAKISCNVVSGSQSYTAGKTDPATCLPTGEIKTAMTQPLPAGTNVIGGTNPAAAATGGATPGHFLSAATNNSTSVKGSAGTLYTLEVVQTTTTLGDLRLYDSAAAPTCSSATGVVKNYAVQSNATSPGFIIDFGAAGIAFANGIGICLTGAVSDSDNTSFVTGVQVNYSFK